MSTTKSLRTAIGMAKNGHKYHRYNKDRSTQLQKTNNKEKKNKLIPVLCDSPGQQVAMFDRVMCVVIKTGCDFCSSEWYAED